MIFKDKEKWRKNLSISLKGKPNKMKGKKLNLSDDQRKNRSEKAKISASLPKNRKIFLESIQKVLLDPIRRENRKKKIQQTIKRKLEDGTWYIWKTRNIRSFPELFVEKFLSKHNIKFESEKYISRKELGIDKKQGGYFLDFYLPDNMIDLEIDGSQHEQPERKLSDTKRDKLLTNAGFKVVRIKWTTIKNDTGSKYIFDQLNSVIKCQK
jgi:very-short-patch-repair endonuclease